ncbi:MAG TPA: hypothetical protein VMY76_10570 [Gemmatimonadales bacterium]|nr:hypothetical protein [Gemmatimonadales bacterium]
MRYPVLTLALVVGLLSVACSDQTTEVRPDSDPPSISPVTAAACTANDIKAQIDALFPAGPLRTSAQSQFKSIPPKTNKPTGSAVRDKTFNLISFVLTNYKAGKLIGSNVAARVLTLIDALNCFAGLPGLTIPTGALDPNEGAAVVVLPTSGPILVQPASKHGGIFIPGASAPVPTLVTISRLPDFPGPLLTSLDQFPLFYEFSSSPAVTFNNFVTTAVCLADDFSLEVPRIAHNIGTTFGAVEVLPPASSTGVVSCADIEPTEIGARWGIRRMLASVFMPAELHASSMALATTGVGGTTKRFSPFGAVDAASNPGTLGFNPSADAFAELSAPSGGSVDPTPSVRVTSQNGTPIKNVPVTFAVTAGGGTINDGATSATVTTDNNGIASLGDWTLGSGTSTNTLTATPPAGAQVTTTAPAFKPAVAFSPTSVTFTAETELSVLGCDQEGIIRSLNSDKPVDVTFVNNSSQTVSVFWLNTEGVREYPFEGGGIGFPYQELDPGASYVQSTFVTHPWIVTSGSGEGEFCYGIFLPGSNGGTVTVTDPDPGPIN